MSSITTHRQRLLTGAFALVLALGTATPSLADDLGDDVTGHETASIAADEEESELLPQLPMDDGHLAYDATVTYFSPWDRVSFDIPQLHVDYANDAGNIERVWGDTALDTMQAIVGCANLHSVSDKYCTAGDTVIIATADGYWDALAASGLVGVSDGVLVITPKDRLCDQARAVISSINPGRAVLVGGPNSLSDAVFDQVKAMVDNTVRVSGQDAQGTAIAIYNSVKEHSLGRIVNMTRTGSWGETAIIASSTGYWDALSVSPAAYSNSAPIFLTTDAKVLSQDTLNSLKHGKFSKAIIVGGNMSVDESVESQLWSIGVEPRRIAGNNAIETSGLIAAWEVAECGFNYDSSTGIAIATSNGYWDALSVGPVCGNALCPLVLSEPGDYRAIQAVNSGVRYVRIAGGPSSVPDETVQWILNNVSVL